MIYTVGNEQIYLSAIEHAGLTKNARSTEYPTAKVWATVEAARAVLEPEMAVFGVEADWETDTAPDENEGVTYRHLTVEAKVIQLPDYPYFVNRTPFKVGMPADVAHQIIKKTSRKTKKAPLKIGKDSKGEIVKWFLVDCVLILRRLVAPAGPYVVTGIRPKEV